MGRYLSRRVQFFEFGDQSWLKGPVRDCYNDCLNFVTRSLGHYKKAYIHLSLWAKKADFAEVLDLASGGAAPIDILLSSADKKGVKLPKFILSDLFPREEYYREVQEKYGEERVGYLSESVSVINANATGISLRSICSAFHHFPPEYAEKILEDALRKGKGIFILEPYERKVGNLLMTLCFGLFIGMLSPFFSKQIRPLNVLLCTLIPIVSLMVQFDGIVSVLRTYEPKEILEMLPKGFELDTDYGRIDPRSRLNATYFYALKK